MKISNYLRSDLIFLDLDAQRKDNAIAKIVELMEKNHVLTDSGAFLNEVLQRESLGSTAIGKGVALPHARTQNVKEIVIAFARLKEGVDFEAEDREPVRLIFLLGTPLDAVGEYLKVLARLSKLLRDAKIRKGLLKAESPKEVLELFSNAEQ